MILVDSFVEPDELNPGKIPRIDLFNDQNGLRFDQVLVELPVDQDFSPTTQNMK